MDVEKEKRVRDDERLARDKQKLQIEQWKLDRADIQEWEGLIKKEDAEKIKERKKREILSRVLSRF